VVEECPVLSVKSVRGVSNYHAGLVRWRCGHDEIATIKYEINLWSAERGGLWLSYSIHGSQVCRTISMTSTKLHSGGRRWWFICPVTGERVGKLYLPDGATHFAGRKAHDLAAVLSVYDGELTSSSDGMSARGNDSNLQTSARAAAQNSLGRAPHDNKQHGYGGERCRDADLPSLPSGLPPSCRTWDRGRSRRHSAELARIPEVGYPRPAGPAQCSLGAAMTTRAVVMS
jgi:hypothetical protein